MDRTKDNWRGGMYRNHILIRRVQTGINHSSANLLNTYHLYEPEILLLVYISDIRVSPKVLKKICTKMIIATLYPVVGSRR